MKNVFLTLSLVGIFSCLSSASLINVTTTTDRQIYNLGEPILISITAYNPNDYDVTLEFSSGRQAFYKMDGTWTPLRYYIQSFTSQAIPSHGYFTWHDGFGGSYWSVYPLGIGPHLITGYVENYGEHTASFEVIPEPTVLCFLFGGLLLSHRRFLRPVK